MMEATLSRSNRSALECKGFQCFEKTVSIERTDHFEVYTHDLISASELGLGSWIDVGSVFSAYI